MCYTKSYPHINNTNGHRSVALEARDAVEAAELHRGVGHLLDGALGDLLELCFRVRFV